MPDYAIPAREGFGRLYPWRQVAIHSRTQAHLRRVDSARRVIDARPNPGGLGWYVAVSGGKDSMAMAALLAEQGALFRGVCCLRPDLDYPAKELYVERLTRKMGHRVDLLDPPFDVDGLQDLILSGFKLTDEPNKIGKHMAEAGTWGWVSAWLYEHDYRGVFLGLRQGESRGRKMNRATKGRTYTRRDMMTVCQPIADWSALDVHAFLLARDIPLLPLYLCVDPDSDPFSLREDTMIAGGGTARMGGHYAWLRRWWPEDWDRFAEADPTIALLS